MMIEITGKSESDHLLIKSSPSSPCRTNFYLRLPNVNNDSSRIEFLEKLSAY